VSSQSLTVGGEVSLTPSQSGYLYIVAPGEQSKRHNIFNCAAESGLGVKRNLLAGRN